MKYTNVAFVDHYLFKKNKCYKITTKQNTKYTEYLKDKVYVGIWKVLIHSWFVEWALNNDKVEPDT